MLRFLGLLDHMNAGGATTCRYNLICYLSFCLNALFYGFLFGFWWLNKVKKQPNYHRLPSFRILSVLESRAGSWGSITPYKQNYSIALQ